jgi:DNA-binding NtrC family response regulator
MNSIETSGGERILIVDDDKAFRIATVTVLQDAGYAVSTASNGSEALQKLSDAHFDLILSDLVMEGMNGLEFLRRVRQKLPAAYVIMVTGFASIQTAVEAMRDGAYDYLTKPCNNEELLIRVRRALAEQRKSTELERLRQMLETTYSFSNIVSRNEGMQKIFKLVKQVADTDVTVLVLGETGTGKELVARSIHFNSQRRERPFITVNCSAMPETLLESELFGHEKGSFTGANRQRLGKFEEAGGGTVFLDEIADIPLHLQTKLLRFLQEKQFDRLGSNTPIMVDVRVIAATNRNLEEMSAAGKFREDFYYRLNVFPITLPPLRQRLDDVPLLAEYFRKKYESLGRHPVKDFSPSVIHAMMNHDWKGNVREMENLIKRAIIKTDGDVIDDIELPSFQRLPSASESVPDPARPASLSYKKYLDQIVRDAEEKYIRRMLKEWKGNLNQVAQAMEVDRKTVYRKISEFGIDVQKYKS